MFVCLPGELLISRQASEVFFEVELYSTFQIPSNATSQYFPYGDSQTKLALFAMYCNNVTHFKTERDKHLLGKKVGALSLSDSTSSEQLSYLRNSPAGRSLNNRREVLGRCLLSA